MVEARKSVSSAKVLVLPKLQLGARTFHNSLVIHTDLKASEYGDTWKAGAALGYLLELDMGKSMLQDAVVLELGSGCGYAGLVASKLGAKVILTDQKPLLGVLTKNVAANKDNLPALPAVSELDWRFSVHRNQLASAYPHFDYIMASDCIYEEDCIEPLITVLRAMCSPRPSSRAYPCEDVSNGSSIGADSCSEAMPQKQTVTKILMSLENRGPGSTEIHATFFSKMKAWFKIEEITLDCSFAQQLLRSDLRVFAMQRRG